MGTSPQEGEYTPSAPRLDTTTAHSARVWNYLLGAIVTRLLDALPPGSYLALSDGTGTSPALNEAITAYNQNSAGSYYLRSPQQIARFFDGLTLVPPGVVTTSRWRPELADTRFEPREVDAICGVGRRD